MTMRTSISALVIKYVERGDCAVLAFYVKTPFTGDSNSQALGKPQNTKSCQRNASGFPIGLNQPRYVYSSQVVYGDSDKHVPQNAITTPHMPEDASDSLA